MFKLTWSPLKVSNFEAPAGAGAATAASGKCSHVLHVSYIYAVLTAMSARVWLDEYERVNVRDEKTSLALGGPVIMTYRFVLVLTPSAR